MKTNSPVYTRVVNHYDRDKILAWAGQTPIFVAANSETVVDFDIWSLATVGQREGIKAELPKGKIQLFVGVLSPIGYTETLLDIDGAADAIAFMNAPKSETKTYFGKDEVFATGLDTIPGKPVPECKTTSTETATTITVVMPANPIEDAIQSARTAFDSHVASKEWAKALEDMKSIYGDKVTFGPRSIMTTKSWDALVTKHRLAVED